jgi:hypothetical protein
MEKGKKKHKTRKEIKSVNLCVSYYLLEPKNKMSHLTPLFCTL